MRRYFLWRENYVDFLWATNVTAKSYFFDSGLLVYEDCVLSAFATKKELERIKKKESAKINSLVKLERIEFEFIEFKKEIACFIKENSRKQISKVTDKELYDTFLRIFRYFSRFVKKYRYLEPHVVKIWEDKAIGLIEKACPDNNPEVVLSEILSADVITSKFLEKFNLSHAHEVFIVLEKISKIRFQAKIMDENLIEFSERTLMEAAKRTNIALSQISHMSKDELNKVLVRHVDIDLYPINLRSKGFCIEIKNGDFEMLPQKRYNQIIKQERAKLDSDFVKGVTAYPGNVTGIARVTPLLGEPEEYREYIQTLTNEDIVIAAMTSPELTASFKKVKGVITDEGGVMSHAALISRETKTPCVIGTKYATRFFKDGDKILLDADNAIVSKV